MELTPRQADVLLIVRNHRHLHGYSPSIREIATSLGISRATTMAHIERLEKKGFLRRTPLRHRTLEVVEDAQGVKPQPTRREREKPKLSKLEQIQAQLDALRTAG
jgi:repressor LexA